MSVPIATSRSRTSSSVVRESTAMPKWSMAPRPPIWRRSPMMASGGTSKMLSAAPPPSPTMAMRGWSPSAAISNCLSAPNASAYQATVRSRSALRVAMWLNPQVIGMARSFG